MAENEASQGSALSPFSVGREGPGIKGGSHGHALWS